MKLKIRQVYFVCLLLLITSLFLKVNAQVRGNDLIVKRDSSRVLCKIQVVTDNTIQYKKANDPEGPVFHVLKSEIARIVYGNGETETFQNSSAKSYIANREAVILYPTTPWLFPGFTEKLSAWTPEELRGALSFYQSKAKARRITAIVSGSVGAAFSIIGIALMSSSRNYDSTFGYYTDDYDKRQIGQVMLIGGLGAGIPITLVNGISAGKYKRKAALVEDELTDRNLSSVQLRLKPTMNLSTKSASLSLICQF